MTLKSQYKRDVITFRVKVNYKFPKKKRGKKNLKLQTMFTNKMFMETRFIIFPTKKKGKYSSFIKYNLFVKIENIMLDTIHKIERFEISR